MNGIRISLMCLTLITFVSAETTNIPLDGIPASSPTNDNQTIQNTSLIIEAEAISDRKVNQDASLITEVFSYIGKLNHNEICISDASKEDILQARRNHKPKMTFGKLLETLQNESCNVDKFLECRQVGVKPQKDHISSISAQVEPIWRCSCPDYEKIDTVHPNAFFDKSMDKCVLKVRAKCSGFVIPPSGKRDASDNRTQPTFLPCVENAVCNILNGSNESTNVNDNKCVCKPGLFPGDDNLCYKAGNDESSSGIINAFVLIFVAFALFFAIMLYEGVLNNGRHGSQGDVNILGEQSRKKLFPNSKRRL